MAAITIDVRQIDGIAAIFDRAEARGRNLEPLMDRIGMAMEASTEERFAEERAPDGGKWQPSIRVRQSGGKTLTLSGRLANSITHRASADNVEIGTNLIYAAVHQFGATIRAKGGGRLAFTISGLGLRRPEQVIVPARPYLGVGGDDELTIVELAEDFFGEEFPQ